MFLLLFLTAALPLQPILANAHTSTNLPMCCRRTGLHHCMAMESEFNSSLSPGSNPPRFTPAPCPMWKLILGSSLTASSIVARGVASQSIAVGTVLDGAMRCGSAYRLRRGPIRAPPSIE